MSHLVSCRVVAVPSWELRLRSKFKAVIAHKTKADLKSKGYSALLTLLALTAPNLMIKHQFWSTVGSSVFT